MSEDREMSFKLVFENKLSTKTKNLIDHLVTETIENNLKRRDWTLTVNYEEEIK